MNKSEALEIISSSASNEIEELNKKLHSHQMYCALIYDGKVMIEKSHAIKNEKDELKIKLNSISKFYTSLLCLIAVSERKLTLDTPITDFFCNIRLLYKNEDVASEITVGILLSHSSGFMKEAKVGNNFIFCNDIHEYIDSLTDQDLLFRPGTNYCYSNIGYNLCGIILSKIYHMSFEELLNCKLGKSICKSISFQTHNVCMLPSSGMAVNIDDAVNLFMYGIRTLMELSQDQGDDLITEYYHIWSDQECGYGLVSKVYYCGNHPYLLSTGTDYENYMIQMWSPTHKFGGLMWTRGNVNEVIDAFEENDIFYNTLCKLEKITTSLYEKKEIRLLAKRSKSYISYEGAMLYVNHEEQDKVLISFDKKEWITLQKEGSIYFNDGIKLTFSGCNELRLDGVFCFGYYFLNDSTCEYSTQIEELCNNIYSIESVDENGESSASEFSYYRKFVRAFFSYSNHKLLLNRKITIKSLRNNKYLLPNGISMVVNEDALWIGNLKFIKCK